ncbi:response regulator transcription factor [Streptomyces sp. NBC_00158]|uniref:response regulator transcription factor n=1 Tax=Streptomyces sp. NBC_00158 TaxID=2903627 RepID=UPI0032497AB8
MSHETALAHSFTPREREILSQLPDGDTYQAIARRLGLSPHTVDTYVRRLRGKTGTTNRTQLAVLATRLGFSSCGPAPAHPEPTTAAAAPGTGL